MVLSEQATGPARFRVENVGGIDRTDVDVTPA